ncbi:2-keto-3-deoxy-L-rhamnonate aldolase RhmA [Pseudomonas baetica]|uniref:2-keto-3-deoxy-L-rhamnonate aldolase RhmA n=1 Tax=Pseudomonas baetica TaxID=674054 RepID=A0ABX4PSZ4_9PSED|nr:aldolase/citrate lyase family protein [Pseudomonas baetica]PKA68159.1 2-keto-3-deoxy-L-rhamnonate aldolase RhmA [Pseudomonas baetica]PTC17968.1 aldolase [Pseudomonas baetica]
MQGSQTLGFRQRFLQSTAMFGTFIKTPTSHAVEIVGALGFDFVVIDAEHGPFDRRSIDTALLAARASATAALVRVADSGAAQILAALDDGAEGVIAPHIDSVAKAEAFVAACKYSRKRGFSNSPRAGGYGAKGLWQHADEADQTVLTIAMIEDPTALDSIDEIVCVEGLDAIFIGRGDLCVALQDRAPGMPLTELATAKIIAAARRAGKAICMLAATAEEAHLFQRQGVRGFVISSDQGFLRSAASQALDRYRSSCLNAG